jgi:hypothetical protein
MQVCVMVYLMTYQKTQKGHNLTYIYIKLNHLMTSQLQKCMKYIFEYKNLFNYELPYT